MTSYSTLTYEIQGAKAYLTLKRPDRLNAIDDVMPGEIRTAVEQADDDVRMIVVAAAGRAPCAGYDLKKFAEGEAATSRCAATCSSSPTTRRSATRRRRFGAAPRPRCGSTGSGAERAKRMLVTGDAIDGTTAASWGLGRGGAGGRAGPRGRALGRPDADVPTNQLVMQKLMINQAYDNTDLQGTQPLATVFDGVARNSEQGHWFKELAEQEGFHAAVAWRDSSRPIPNGG